MSALADGEIDDDDEIKDFLSNVAVDVTLCTKWEDIVGIQAASDKMKEFIILPAKFPQLFRGNRRGHLLMYGPPGTGKTLLVQTTIAELSTCNNTLCYRLSAYELLSRWHKNPLKALQAMFRKAEGYKHCVMFIDDVEVLHSQSEQTEMSSKLRTELYTLARNFPSKCRECSLCIVGVTNKPWKLADNYLFRRLFDRRAYIPLPDNEARQAIFKQLLSSVQHSLSEADFKMLGDRSEGLSGADISVVVRDSSMQPVRKVQAATHFKHVCGPSTEDPNKMVDDLVTPCSRDDPDAIEMNWTQIETNKLAPQDLTMEDVVKSLSTQKPSVSKEEVDMFEQFKEEFGPE